MLFDARFFCKTYYFSFRHYLVTGRFDKATDDFDKVIQIEPRNEYAIILQGTSYYSKKKYKDSVRYFKRALESNPQNIAALNNISVSYIYLDMLDQSFKHLMRGLKIKPKDINLLNNLGLTYSVKGDPAMAVKAYSRALSYRYDSDIQSNLAFSLFELGQTEKAINQWKNAHEKDPNNLDAEAGLAAGYYAVADFKNAKEHFSNVIKVDQNYCNIQVVERDYLWPKRSRSVVAELISKECVNK